MKSSELPSEYRQVYEELQAYLHSSSRGGLKNQPIQSIESFAHHYLVALSMLSRMRANPSLHPYIPAFQKALLEANILLYPEESLNLRQIVLFFWTYLPAQLWKNRWYYLAATTICGACTMIGFLIVMQNFEMASVLMPSGLRSSHELEAYLFSNHAQTKMLTSGRESSYTEKSLFATFLMINNIKVAILCFTMGIFFGIPTLIILIQTGLMLGTLPALFYGGDLYGLGAWLLPHGVPEVSAILLAGGAGLKLGLAVLKPSPVGMGMQFKKDLKSVLGTVIVCVILLIWAGLVESFVRQSQLSNEVRYSIAGFSLIPLFLLFLRAFIAHQQLAILQSKKL